MRFSTRHVHVKEKLPISIKTRKNDHRRHHTWGLYKSYRIASLMKSEFREIEFESFRMNKVDTHGFGRFQTDEVMHNITGRLPYFSTI